MHVFHQIWPNYRGNLLIFCIFGVGSQTFSFKDFSRDVDFGRGVQMELLDFGANLDEERRICTSTT